MTVTDNDSALALAIDTGKQLAQPIWVQGRAYQRTDSGKLTPIYEAWTQPARITADPVFKDPGDWIDYIKRFSPMPAPAVFAARTAQAIQIQAVLDYHTGPTDPGFCNHRATLNLERPAAFAQWQSVLGKWIPQEDFCDMARAAWKRGEIVAPAPADLLETLAQIESQTSEAFTSVVRENGERALAYSTSTTTRGKIPLPEAITIALPFWKTGKSDVGMSVALALDARVSNKQPVFRVTWPTQDKDERELAYSLIESLATRGGFPILQ